MRRIFEGSFGVLVGLLSVVFLFATSYCAKAEVDSCRFAQRDSSALWMDVYQPESAVRKNICVIYLFGGGFVGGSRKADHNVKFFNDMVARGYTVVAIDYRLGLKGVAKVGVFHPRPGFEAVRMATEDLIAATSYLLDNHKKLMIDPSRIVLMGSSAGAITVLQADYELSNRTAMTSLLPADFRYAGVVSLAGAIFSTQGKPSYATAPSPTLMYHGTKDKVVVYNKLRLFNRGMFGSSSLVKIFKRNNYPFMMVRYKDIQHSVSTFPRFASTDQICSFIDTAASGKYTDQIDMTISDKELTEKYK